jgi:Protein of unknown function (DUF2905)
LVLADRCLTSTKRAPGVMNGYGVHKLPGDIVIHRGNFTLYLPLG